MYVLDLRSIGANMTMGPWAADPQPGENGLYTIRQVHSGKLVGTCTKENLDLFLSAPELVDIAAGKAHEHYPISPSEKRLAEEVEDSVDAMLFISDILSDLARQLDPEDDLEAISLLDNCSEGLRDPEKALAWKKSTGK